MIELGASNSSELEKSIRERTDQELSYTGTTSELPFSIVEINLAEERTIYDPLRISFPFRSVFVQAATDPNVELKLALGKRSLANLQDALPLKVNQYQNFGFMRGDAYLYWDAQPGKKMILIFVRDGDIKPGSTIQVTSGGVAITSGASMTPATPVSVTVTATKILSAASDRKKATIGNPRSSGVDVWVSGTSAVTTELGALPGILLEPGDYFEYDGQGDLYGITAGGSVALTLNVEN